MDHLRGSSVCPPPSCPCPHPLLPSLSAWREPAVPSPGRLSQLAGALVARGPQGTAGPGSGCTLCVQSLRGGRRRCCCDFHFVVNRASQGAAGILCGGFGDSGLSPAGHLAGQQVLRTQPALCALGTRSCMEYDRLIGLTHIHWCLPVPGSGVTEEGGRAAGRWPGPREGRRRQG